MVTVCGAAFVNCLDCGNHYPRYTYMKTSRYTPYIQFLSKYKEIKMKNVRVKKKLLKLCLSSVSQQAEYL